MEVGSATTDGESREGTLTARVEFVTKQAAEDFCKRLHSFTSAVVTHQGEVQCEDTDERVRRQKLERAANPNGPPAPIAKSAKARK
jgi:hypothetical protein